MKKITLVIAAICLISCTKEEMCDCTYFSEEKTSKNPTYKVTYESTWDGCDNEDFGTSIFTHYDGTTTTTHTYVKCK